MCRSKSLPSANDGVQNYTLIKTKEGYLSLGHDERRLEGEFVSEKNVKIEFVDAFVHILAIYCALIYFQLRRRMKGIYLVT
jgi:hypothetical protein